VGHDRARSGAPSGETSVQLHDLVDVFALPAC
jgi:hypothetical protein